ncbi:MAG TPA: HAMP domain-containing histidine kinase [Phycisphaerales bacterium]|nr:HAMP domain-containing histidine kinase [Phycisphaerales bacterium]
MIDDYGTLLRPLLHRQMIWVISLRWYAGAAIILFDLVQWFAGPFFEPAGVMMVVGVALLLFNAAALIVTRRSGDGSATDRLFLLIAWSQLSADLVALTVFVLLTGGLSSPAIGFFLFPMIFASLFLTRAQAYAAALLAIAMLTASLALTGRWPSTGLERMTAIGWIVTLFCAVHIVNRLTRGLFGRERDRLRQERRLHELHERLENQKQAMRHLDKMVSVGQLAAGVAHEISNPLASMDGLLQLMQRSPEKPRPEAVARLREQINRISETVRQMTALSRPDLGRPEQVDVNALIRETIEILGYDCRLREIRVLLDLDEIQPIISARPRALQQVLMNLVFNAADAVSGRSGAMIIVRTRFESGLLRIEVVDNGPGVAEEIRERVFEPFVTTKPEGTGTGLGLPNSRDLVHAQGGTLTFECPAGGGTVFSISIPVDQQSGRPGKPV